MRELRHHPLWFVILTTAGASSVSLIGGIGIEVVSEKLLPLIPLVVALPALNTMVGDYSTIIAAHAGDPFKRARTWRQLIRAVSWSVIINVAGVTLLSLIIASQRDFPFSWGFSLRFGLFVAVAIVISVAFMFFLTYTLDRVLEQRRLNPDDVLIPIVTSVSDVIMLGMIALGTVIFF
jgi:cation transporter-like permease